MRWGALLITLIVLLTTGCSERIRELIGAQESETSGGGLTARLLDEVRDGFDGVVAGPNHLYAQAGNDAYLIDPATGAPPNPKYPSVELHVDGDTRRSVADNGDIWFTAGYRKPGRRVPLSGGDPVQLVMPNGLDAAGVAVSGETGWVMAPSEGKAVPFTTDGVPGTPVDVPCDMVVFNEPLIGSPGAVWSYCEEGVARIDTAAGTASIVDIGGRPSGLALTSSALWAARDGKLFAIDLATGRVTKTVDRPDANRLAGFGDDLWVTGGGITLHSGSDGAQVAGPVGLPKVTDEVGTGIQEMAAFGGKLFVTLNFYGTPLVMVERET